MKPFWAHTPNAEKNIPPHLLKNHLEDVASRAVKNAEDIAVPHVKEYLKLAGLLHDLGKYKLEFQRGRLEYDPVVGNRLAPQNKKVDHSSMGAVKIFRQSPAYLLISRIIAAHHAGLSDYVNFEERIREKSTDPYNAEAWNYFKSEFPTFGSPPLQPLELKAKSQEFLTRMLLSCLVDADQTDTEAHCDPQRNAIRSRKIATLEELWQRLKTKQQGFTEVSSLNTLRNEMYGQALERLEAVQSMSRKGECWDAAWPGRYRSGQDKRAY